METLVCWKVLELRQDYSHLKINAYFSRSQKSVIENDFRMRAINIMEEADFISAIRNQSKPKIAIFADNWFHSRGRGSYILKAGDAGDQTPQTIWIFRRKIVWERENYQSEFLKTSNSAMCSSSSSRGIKKSYWKAQNLWPTCSWFQIFWHFAFKGSMFEILLRLKSRIRRLFCF